MMRGTFMRAGGFALLVAVVGASWPTRVSAARNSEEDAAGVDEGGGQSADQSRWLGATTGPLTAHIPSVSRRQFSGAGRMEMQALVGVSFADPFYTNYALGGGFDFHIPHNESLSVGMSATYYVVDATPTLVTGGVAREPEYNHLVYAAGMDVTWALAYGKLNLFAESVLHFDTFVSVGGGVAGARAGGRRGVVRAALGQHYFINEWMALRWELRDQILRLARAPSVGVGEHLENFLTLGLGLCFYLPRHSDALAGTR